MKRSAPPKARSSGAKRPRLSSERNKRAAGPPAATLAEQQLRLALDSVITESREMEERMRAIYENSADGFVIFDDQARPIDCNPALQRLFKLHSPKEFVERFFELSPPRQPDGTPSQEAAARYLKAAYDQGFQRFQ